MAIRTVDVVPISPGGGGPIGVRRLILPAGRFAPNSSAVDPPPRGFEPLSFAIYTLIIGELYKGYSSILY